MYNWVICSLQKKSREESEGTESGVEILENRPYTDGPHGSGQYTYKVPCTNCISFLLPHLQISHSL